MNDIADALLDTKLEDLADSPEFVTPPAGAYNFTGVEFKTDSDDDGNLVIILVLNLTETLELASAEAVALPPNTEVNFRYGIDNEYAQGNFKRISEAYKETYGIDSLRGMQENFAGSTGAVLVTNRVMRQTPEQKAAGEEVKVFAGIKTLELE